MNYVITGERTVRRPRNELYNLLRARLQDDPGGPGDSVAWTPYDSIELDWRAPKAGPGEPPGSSGPFGDRGRLHLAFSSVSGRATQVQLRMSASVSLRWWLVLKLFGKGAGLDGGLMIDDLLRGLVTPN